MRKRLTDEEKDARRTARYEAKRAAEREALRITDSNAAWTIRRGDGSLARFNRALEATGSLDHLSPRQRDLVDRAIALFAECEALEEEQDAAEQRADELAEQAYLAEQAHPA